MTTLTIFWVAILAIVFFLLWVICNGLASVLSATFNTIILTIKAGLIGIGLMIFIYLLYETIEGISTMGAFDIMSMIILQIATIVLLMAVLGGVGGFVGGIIFSIISYIFTIILFALEEIANLSERIYGYFLNIIVNRLEK